MKQINILLIIILIGYLFLSSILTLDVQIIIALDIFIACILLIYRSKNQSLSKIEKNALHIGALLFGITAFVLLIPLIL